MTMKIYVTVNAPAVEEMIKERKTSGRAPSNSQAVEQLLLELLDLREKHEQLMDRLMSGAIATQALVAPAVKPSTQPADPERMEF